MVEEVQKLTECFVLLGHLPHTLDAFALNRVAGTEVSEDELVLFAIILHFQHLNKPKKETTFRVIISEWIEVNSTLPPSHCTLLLNQRSAPRKEQQRLRVLNDRPGDVH